MFTGLIEEVGRVLRLVRRGEGAHLYVAADRVLEGTRLGDSIDVNGACLTVVERSSSSFAVDCMAETLAHTTIGSLVPGARVNLERAMAMGDRLGGHLVLGHVDAVGTVVGLTQRGIAWEVRVSLPLGMRGLVAPKGSIAVDGISLTVTDVGPGDFGLGIIPHTLKETTLQAVAVGVEVNLEADVLARYVWQALGAMGADRGGAGDAAESGPTGRRPVTGGLSEALLRDHGFFD